MMNLGQDMPGTAASRAKALGCLRRSLVLLAVLAACGSGVAAKPAAQAAPASVDNTHSKDDDADDEPVPGAISEEEIRRLLVGKSLYLRGGYLDNTLSFNQQGALIGKSPQGSFTLSALEISKVELRKHRLELEGTRFGLHFLGQLANQDQAGALDRVRISPPRRMVRISIDREWVAAPKKAKEKKPEKAGKTAPQLPATDPKGPAAHAAQTMRDALKKIFAEGLDEQMMASLPDFWRLYYQAVAAKSDYRPGDPAVLRQATVDKKARLLSVFEPPSNKLAQANGVAGVALYHAVIGPDGKAAEIAVGRPIGFGLDENAVESIRKASFEPAVKDGKPVAVLLDLVVQFRIYSGRTAAVAAPPQPDAKPAQRPLPGPYSLPH